jgi:secreted PhoX family phosphatase
MKKTLQQTIALALGLLPAITLGAGNSPDFGLKIQKLLSDGSLNYFGFEKPVAKSAVDPNGADQPSRAPGQPASAQIALAEGLTVRYLTREAANHTDMMAFWPSEQGATHIISCIESDLETLTDGRKNPSVQRIDLASGEAQTILRGMNGCDGIRLTPWGTIVATEENSDGGVYEILNPLVINNSTVSNRAKGTILRANGSPESRIVKRTALPLVAYEGLHLYPNGVMYFGDELRPGDREDASGDKIPDADGGALYKFVPKKLRTGNEPITSLDQSPLVAGKNYAMQISCLEDTAQFGQGCEIGGGTWVPVSAAKATADAAAAGATGYYRPEDLHGDTSYRPGADSPNAVRLCWNNTGRKENANWGEVLCAVDANSADPASKIAANRFVEGDSQFNQPDNLAFQPVTNNVYVIEDNPNGDIWACLRDGKDRDNKSDGCLRMLSVVDASAEPTGFVFSGDGKKAYVSIQHSDDTDMRSVDGFGTDDVLEISGFQTR